MIPRNLAPLTIASIALAGLFVLGAISLFTSLFTAIAIGLMVFGVARIFSPGGNPMLGVIILGVGLMMFFLRTAFPALSIAEAFGIGAFILPGAF